MRRLFNERLLFDASFNGAFVVDGDWGLPCPVPDPPVYAEVVGGKTIRWRRLDTHLLCDDETLRVLSAAGLSREDRVRASIVASLRKISADSPDLRGVAERIRLLSRADPGVGSDPGLASDLFVKGLYPRSARELDEIVGALESRFRLKMLSDRLDAALRGADAGSGGGDREAVKESDGLVMTDSLAVEIFGGFDGPDGWVGQRGLVLPEGAEVFVPETGVPFRVGVGSIVSGEGEYVAGPYAGRRSGLPPGGVVDADERIIGYENGFRFVWSSDEGCWRDFSLFEENLFFADLDVSREVRKEGFGLFCDVRNAVCGNGRLSEAEDSFEIEGLMSWEDASDLGDADSLFERSGDLFGDNGSYKVEVSPRLREGFSEKVVGSRRRREVWTLAQLDVFFQRVVSAGVFLRVVSSDDGFTFLKV